MLIELRFKNFRSFKNETVFSLTAGPVRQLPDNVSDGDIAGGLKLVKSAIVLGANASGKSSLFEAVRFVRRLVRASVEDSVEGRLPVEPFLLDPASTLEPSEFETSFVMDGTRYQYGFRVSAERVEAEWLHSYPHGRSRTLISRDSTEPDQPWGGPSLRGEKAQIQSLTRPDALFLSVASKLNQEQLRPVYRWLTERLAVLLPWGDQATRAGRYTARKASEDPSFRSWLLRYLQAADLGVADLEMRSQVLEFPSVPPPAEADQEFREFLAAFEKLMESLPAEMRDRKTHKPTLFHAGKEGPVPIPFDEESRGTKRLFQLLGPIANVLENGETLFIDEMATSLHPYLARQIVQAFHDPVVNPRSAQLIINTHDPSLLDPSLYRKDQVWFVEKDPDGVSTITPLSAFKDVRSDQPFQWYYLAGKLGGVPIVSQLEPLPTDSD